MMNSECLEACSRIVARLRGQVVPVRAVFALAPDPECVLLLAPLVGADGSIQALAVGRSSDKTPKFYTDTGGRDRHAGFLVGFCRGLREFVANADEFRLWLLHNQALLALAQFVERQASNIEYEDVRQAAQLLSDILFEARHADQQVLGVATAQFRSHAVSGCAALEDNHAGIAALWLEPSGRTGAELVELSDQLALDPVSASLNAADDAKLLELRRQLRSGMRTSRAGIERILRQAALREWRLLQQVHAGFWRLGLEHALAIAELAASSNQRFRAALGRRRYWSEVSLAIAYDVAELAEARRAAADIQADNIARGRARENGRVFSARLIALEKDKPNRITLETGQKVLHIRAGVRVALLDNEHPVLATIEQISTETEATIIKLQLEKGVRSLPTPGIDRDWTDVIAEDLTFLRRQNHFYKPVSAPARQEATNLSGATLRELAAGKRRVDATD